VESTHNFARGKNDLRATITEKSRSRNLSSTDNNRRWAATPQTVLRVMGAFGFLPATSASGKSRPVSREGAYSNETDRTGGLLASAAERPVEKGINFSLKGI